MHTDPTTTSFPRSTRSADGSRWGSTQFMSWFDEYHRTVGPRLARAEASKLGIAGHAEDIHQEWYLRLRGSVLARGSGATGLDIREDDAARAYSWVVLRRTAIDCWRRNQHLEELDENSLDQDAPLDELLVRAQLAAVRRQLRAMEDAIEPSRRRSTEAATIGVAIAVIDVATGREVGPVSDDPRGGTSEWDRLLHRALLLWHARGGHVVVGRGDAAVRQRRSRCGRRVRCLLDRLLTEQGCHGDDGEHAGSSVQPERAHR